MADDPTATPAPNPAAAFQAALAKANNDGIQLASTLFDENFQLRAKNRDLKAKQPKDGSIVLADEDAKEWNAFKALNVKAEDAKKAIESVSVLEKENKELGQMENLRELSDIGLDGSKLKLSVLKDQLARFPSAELSFKTEKDKDGKEAKVAYIKKDKDSKELAFTEFANAELADYLPALKVNAEATTQQPVFGRTQDPQPRQQGGSVFDAIRDRAKQRNEEQSKAPSLAERLGRAA